MKLENEEGGKASFLECQSPRGLCSSPTGAARGFPGQEGPSTCGAWGPACWHIGLSLTQSPSSFLRSRKEKGAWPLGLS